jgi:hypothetical protein
VPGVVGIGTIGVLALVGGLYLSRLGRVENGQLAKPPSTEAVSPTLTRVPAVESTQVVSPPTPTAPTPSQLQVATIASPRALSSRCGALQAQSIGVSAVPENTPNLGSATGKVEVIAAPASDVAPGMTGKGVHVVVVGPPIGSMDSPDVRTDVSCTARGIALTATITRSADYHDSALKNAVFRPTIDLSVVLQQPDATFQATWKMRLTTGAELDHAQTPPYPEQNYPLTLTATIR